MLGDLRGKIFGHRALLREGRAGILQACGVIHQQPCGLKLRGHLGKLELHALKFGNGFAKLPALLGIRDGRMQGPWARPTICAPMPIRPSLSVSIATL